MAKKRAGMAPPAALQERGTVQEQCPNRLGHLVHPKGFGTGKLYLLAHPSTIVDWAPNYTYALRTAHNPIRTMAEPKPARRIALAIRRIEEGLALLRVAQHEAWAIESKNLALTEQICELEESADPMNDGLPLIDRVRGQNHAN